jgi:hypothetical protein
VRRQVHHRFAIAAAIVAGAAPALAGCAQSSNTASTAKSAPGGAPPTATTPTTPSTPTTSTGSGTTPAPGSAKGLSVSPAVGSPHSVIHFSITPSYRLGAHGNQDISAALSVTGPQEPGCVGVHQEPLSAPPTGQETMVSVGPAQIGGSWCPGTYSARVVVLERPKCGAGQMCPQFIRVLAAIGPVSFRISG